MTAKREAHTIDTLRYECDEPGDGCWIWPMSRHGKVPEVYNAGRMTSVRRLIWELATGEAPEKGEMVRASCRVESCVAREHLEKISVNAKRASVPMPPPMRTVYCKPGSHWHGLGAL